MRKSILLIGILAMAMAGKAEEIGFAKDAVLEDTKQAQMELRQSASVAYDLPKGFDISLEEELREVVYDNQRDPSAYFGKTYTTVNVGWKFFNYTDPNTNYKYSLKLDAGYTLRYLATKGTNPTECLVHRPIVALTGSATFGDWKVSLRERYQVDCRLDSVNPLEKAKNKMELRSRVRVEYQIPGKPLKPYAQIELTNTLNEPTWRGLTHPTTGEAIYGGQYLNSVRTMVGLKWKLDKNNSLSLYYVFAYLKDREVNISHKNNINRFYYNHNYKHIVTLAYSFNG